MIKTHSKSRFQLKTLEEIRDSVEIVLQIEKTDSSFIDSKKTAYLCEVVNPRDYRATPTLEQMAEELVKANNDTRTTATLAFARFAISNLKSWYRT